MKEVVRRVLFESLKKILDLILQPRVQNNFYLEFISNS